MPFSCRLLLRTSRKTERGARQFLIRLEVRAAPFALLGNTRKTECGASELLICLAVRAAPFGFSRALQPTPANRRSELQQLRPPQISTLFTQWEAALDLSTRPTCFSHLGDGLENLAASIATFGWISLNWVVDLPSNQVTVTRNGIRTPATSR